MFTLIENLEDLNFLNLELSNKPFVAIDTEFRRTSKDNMKLSLMQLNDGEETYIVDCILIKTPGDSCAFLFSKEVTNLIQNKNFKSKFKNLYNEFCQESHNELFDSGEDAKAFYSIPKNYEALLKGDIGENLLSK